MPVVISTLGANDGDLNVYFGEDPVDESLLSRNGSFELGGFNFDIQLPTVDTDSTSLSVVLLSGMRVSVQV